MNGRRIITASIVLAALAWAGTIAAAYQAVRRFETTPGMAADAASSWPVRSAIARQDGQWSLIMLVHPHCSCSRASIQELQAILEKAPHTLRTSVLVYRPSEFPAGWERTDVYEAASRLPRTNVIIDRDGREAAVFGGFTSGQTFLYDGTGRLRFAGGITSLRGHAGVNRGRADVIQIANAGKGSGKHPVFGCAIASPGKRNER